MEQSLLNPIIILDDSFSLRLAHRRATARTTNFVEPCFQQKKGSVRCGENGRERGWSVKRGKKKGWLGETSHNGQSGRGGWK